MNYFSFEILVVIFLASCSGNESNKLKVDGREKSSIEHVIYNNIAWAVTKDTALLKSTMAKDENLFIFNPDSIPTIGWAELEKNFNFWLDPRFRATKTEIRDLRISISQSGTVCMVVCILDDLENGRTANRMEKYTMDRCSGKKGWQMAHCPDAFFIRQMIR
jgi:hypothetical protein